VLNLPGTEECDPTMPRVYRWNSLLKVMACFFGTYIDDIRTGGPTERACKNTSRRVSSRTNYLGQQDASRKRGQPSKAPQAWAGAKCCVLEDDSLYVFSTEHKWQKAKIMVCKWHKVVAMIKMKIFSFEDLEKDVGFFVHMSQTYPTIFPYLKGFYNTMNSWRLDRNTDGWKIGKTAWIALLAVEVAFDKESDVELPFEERKRKFANARPRENRKLCESSHGFCLTSKH